MSNIKLSRTQLIDLLPNDIFMECCKYIHIPHIALLKEIKQYGKIKDSINSLKNLSTNNLINIHYNLLYLWYKKFAKNFFNEMLNDHNSVCIVCNDNTELIQYIKKLAILLSPKDVNNIINNINIYLL